VEVRGRHINEYIKEIMGQRFSAKDFRTLAGTLVCACALARVSTDVNDNRTAHKRAVSMALKQTAATLGNTPAVCRSSYITPLMLREFEGGRVVKLLL
jgi:DNA topoisomerase-1